MADPPPPPPQLSPLSGAYLLIVVGEPFSEEHKQLILNKIRQGRSIVIGKNIREESLYLLKSSRYLGGGGGCTGPFSRTGPTLEYGPIN
jgi:hypothetical protein